MGFKPCDSVIKAQNAPKHPEKGRLEMAGDKQRFGVVKVRVRMWTGLCLCREERCPHPLSLPLSFLTGFLGDIQLLTSCSTFLHINLNSTIWFLRNTQHKIWNTAADQGVVVISQLTSPTLNILLSWCTKPPRPSMHKQH